MRSERIGKNGISLLSCDGDGLLFNFDRVWEAACFGVGGGKCVENRGILPVGQRLCAIGESEGVRAIARSQRAYRALLKGLDIPGVSHA